MKHTVTTLRRAGTSVVVGTALAGLSFVSQPAFAQELDDIQTAAEPGAARTTPATAATTNAPAAAPVAAPDTSRDLPMTFSAGLSYQADADIVRNHAGSFSLTRFNAGLVAPFRLNDSLILATTFKYELASFDFSKPNQPWDNINTLSLSALLQWKANDDWSVYGGPIVRVSAETDAGWGSAWSGGGLIGFNYIFSPTLTLGGGIAVISQIQDDPLVLPLVTANWKFADDWRLKVGFIDVATMGYGADVGYNFSDDFMVSGGVQYHKARFRINGSSADGDVNGVGQEDAAVLYVAATWRACSRTSVNAFLGLATGGGLRIETSGGHKLLDTGYDTTPTLGVKVNITL